MSEVLLTFQSTHQAIRGERVALALGLTCDLIPVPRSINSECGFGLWLESSAGTTGFRVARAAPWPARLAAGLLGALRQGGTVWEAAYDIGISGEGKHYERIHDSD